MQALIDVWNEIVMFFKEYVLTTVAEIGVIDGMVIDKTRKNFDEIGEFNDTSMVEEVKVGDEIRDWLEGRM